jgi:hypothetical protein
MADLKREWFIEVNGLSISNQNSAIRNFRCHLSARQWHDLDVRRAVDDSQDGHCRLHVKALWSGGAWIDDQSLPTPLDERMVRVSEDQDVSRIAREKFGGCRATHFVAVTDVNGESADLCRDFIRQHAVERIDIPVHGLHRRDGAERIEHLASSDVTGVQNL